MSASRPMVDRNLLLGILALQMDFISRDALIAAMNAWVLNKSQSLGDVLVSQQALAPKRLALLESLVEEHVSQHGYDPEKSLIAVGPVGLRRHLQRNGSRQSALGLQSPYLGQLAWPELNEVLADASG
jgi:hypothetical protein